MLKKVYLFFMLMGLVGCQTHSEISSVGGFNDSYTEISEFDLSSSQGFRVGMLLPLSGAAKKHGEGLKNAALMAIDDIKNPNLIVQFYDTKSNASGARVAVENALNQKSQLIIGPLTSAEAIAVAPSVRAKGVPMISFSTSTDFLQPSVYTLGLLIDEQVDRIVSFAAQQGRKRLALLVPDNNTGMAVVKAAIKTAEKNGISVTKIAFYPPLTSDFSKILRQMTNYDSRSAKVEQVKSSLAKSGDIASLRQLEKLKTIDSIGDAGFDSVLIPEYGARLTSAISMFGYYDVYSPDVQFLGTSIWENSNLNHETSLHGAWFPAMSRSYSTYFVNKYNSIFSERPSSLYSLAYDAIALSSSLSKSHEFGLDAAITDSGGYAGMNGVFRLFEDGRNQHSLDIIEIRKDGNFVVDAGPKRFEEDELDQTSDIYTIPTERPIIYGKDASGVYMELFGNMQ